MCQSPCLVAKQTCKNTQPFLTSEITLPTRLLAQKSKRHHSPNLESETPNKIVYTKNQRGTDLRTSRVGISWINIVDTSHTQYQLSRYHRPLYQRFLTKSRHINLEGPATLLLPTRVKEQHHCLIIGKTLCVSISMPRGKADLQKYPTFPHIRDNTPNKITCSKIEEAPLPESRE